MFIADILVIFALTSVGFLAGFLLRGRLIEEETAGSSERVRVYAPPSQGVDRRF